jgi:hypothetical protein
MDTTGAAGNGKLPVVDPSGMCPTCGLNVRRTSSPRTFLALQSALCFILPIAFFVGEVTGRFHLDTIWAAFYGVNVIGVSAAGYGFVKLNRIGLGLNNQG